MTEVLKLEGEMSTALTAVYLGLTWTRITDIAL